MHVAWQRIDNSTDFYSFDHQIKVAKTMSSLDSPASHCEGKSLSASHNNAAIPFTFSIISGLLPSLFKLLMFAFPLG